MLAVLADGPVTVSDLDFLFDRPAEPIFLPKANAWGRQVLFDVPATYLVSAARPDLRNNENWIKCWNSDSRHEAWMEIPLPPDLPIAQYQ